VWALGWTLGVLCALLAAPAVAQTTGSGTGKVQIEVPPLLVAEPATEAALNVRVGPPESVPRSSFLRVRGLPAGVKLNEGHLVSPGVWSVPLFALATLKVQVPPGLSGRSNLTLALMTVDGLALAEAKSAIVVANLAFRGTRDQTARAPDPNNPGLPSPPVPAGKPDRTAAAAEAIQVPPLAQGFAGKAGDMSALDALVTDGQRALELGRLTVARAFWRRAAENGHTGAAVRLAETYDPDEAARLGLKAWMADTTQAMFWYRRAAETGDALARTRLKQLEGR
jgi:hypothetical protein